jgi:hypothetical protein
MIIEGPNGKVVGVNSDGFLKSSATVATVEHHINHHHGTAYTLSFQVTPVGADDCFLYVQNTDDKDMCVEGFYLASATADTIYAEINNTVTDITAGTGYAAVTPVNVNAGSGKTANGVFATGTALDTGSGLSGGGLPQAAGKFEVGRGVLPAAQTIWYNFNQDLILPKNKALTLWAVTGTYVVTGMMEFNYHDDELG